MTVILNVLQNNVARMGAVVPVEHAHRERFASKICASPTRRVRPIVPEKSVVRTVAEDSVGPVPGMRPVWQGNAWNLLQIVCPVAWEKSAGMTAAVEPVGRAGALRSAQTDNAFANPIVSPNSVVTTGVAGHAEIVRRPCPVSEVSVFVNPIVRGKPAARMGAVGLVGCVDVRTKRCL